MKQRRQPILPQMTSGRMKRQRQAVDRRLEAVAEVSGASEQWAIMCIQDAQKKDEAVSLIYRAMTDQSNRMGEGCSSLAS